MANTKRKPEEMPKRSPGKSKFVFPKREAPPVDNTYFDRLFSELQQQNPDAAAPTQVGEISIIEEANSTLGDEALTDQAALSSNQSTSLPQTPLNQDSASKPSRLELTSESVTVKQTVSPITSRKDKHIRAAAEQVVNVYCKPETSSYVDQLKLKFRLSKGEANVLRYLLGATHDKNQAECYITIPKLAEAASLTTRGCQLALKNLQMRGFIVRTEEYDQINKLGIKFQVTLISL